MVGWPGMATPDDRLLGLLAVQLGFLDAPALQRHLARFQGATQTLGTWLVKERVLSAADVALLQACAAQSLKTHGGAAPALEVLTRGAQAYTESFAGFDDTITSGESRVVDSDSLEGLDFVVPEMPGRYVAAGLPELGRGGIGRVLAFEDQVLGRTVALKELHGEATSGAVDTRTSVEQEARFLREARLAAQLEHPAIVPIYEAGRRVDGSLYYTMRRIEGRTLAEALGAAQGLDGRLKLMPHLIALAHALAYAHSRDVIHRDIKPQNVMVGRFGETYLLDWGLARLKARPQRTSGETASAPDITGGLQLGAVGTPSYMSPEQAAGKTQLLDERTDVWGLGAVLYEALTGRPPYLGVNALDCIQHILTDDVLPVRELEPAAPPDLVAVCEKALQRDPARRYRTAGELAADLQAWLEGRTVSAREYSSVQLAARLIKRNALSFSVVGALLLTLLGSAAFFTTRLEGERRDARQLSSFMLDTIVGEISDLPGTEGTLDRIMKPALAFYRAQKEGLTDDERVLVARTLNTMAQQSNSLARMDEARALTRECLEVLPLSSPLAQRSARARAFAVSCTVASYDQAVLGGDDAAAKQRLEVLRQELAPSARDSRAEPRWLEAQAIIYDRLIKQAQSDEEGEALARLVEKNLDLDERALQLEPDSPRVILGSVITATRHSLAIFKPDHPDESLAVARRALERIRTIPRRYQNKFVLRGWGSLLQQVVTTLIWAGRTGEAQQYIDEGNRVFEQLEALEPKDIQGRGVHADFLLALNKPCEALAILEGLHQGGVRGDYFTSRLLAALACGNDAAFNGISTDLAATTDAEAHWLSALWLVKVGRVPEAVTELRAWETAAAASSLQWPLGVLDGFPARVPPAQREAVEAFVRGIEGYLRSEEEGESVRPVFDALISSLSK